jgi:hypothetical protein
MFETADELKDKIIGLYLEKLQNFKRRNGEKMEASEAFTETTKFVNSIWGDFDGRLSLVPGKELFSKLNQKLTDKYGFSLSIMSLSTNMLLEEIDSEIKQVFKEIEDM